MQKWMQGGKMTFTTQENKFLSNAEMDLISTKTAILQKKLIKSMIFRNAKMQQSKITRREK